MRIEVRRLPLQLKNPFTLSYGTSTMRENVLVMIHDGELTGVGEAAVVPYYGETPDRVIVYATDPAVEAAIEAAMNADPLALYAALDALPSGDSMAARAAVDMALHDLWGQRLGWPLYRLWGLDPARCPASSITVAMDDDEIRYRTLIRAVADRGPVKIKLGSGDWQADLRLAQIARDELGPDVPLGVDANGGWSAADTLAMLPHLSALDVVYVEQPVSWHDFEGWRRVHAERFADNPPLIADESVQDVRSVLALAGLADGVNIKLAKAGGLAPARAMIALARALDMIVMVGCMVESSVAVTAAAHLAPLADFADLDGNLLIANDPYRGARMIAGRLALPDAPGLGVMPEGDS